MPGNFNRILILISVTVILVGICAACNTAHGFGRDVEKAGEKIKEGTK